MTEAASQTPADPPPTLKKSARTIAWVHSTYFAEGLPYSIVRLLSSTFFTDIGMKERYIGYLNFLGIPWNVKFLWGPFVDSISTKRRWLIAMQFLLALLTAGLAAVCANASADSDADPSRALFAFVALLIAMAFLAATNDIAIDGYYMEALNKADQASYSGHRILAYRLAVIFVRSGLAAIAAYGAQTAAGENKQLGWAYAFGGGALTLFALSGLHAAFLSRVESEQNAKSPEVVLRSYVDAFKTYLQQEKVVRVLAFIISYKIGDEIMFSMNSAFLQRELGVPLKQVTWITGVVGIWSSIAGSMLGGWWIKKRGLKKAIWPMTLLMNFTIWAYFWLAITKPDPATTTGLATIAAIHAYELAAYGLGNAVLIVYLLRTCSPEHKAGHYAIGSAIMSLGGTLIGGTGGDIVGAVGYTGLYTIAFAASIPSMILLFFIPLKDEA